MGDNDRCPVCGESPYNTSDGASGVCPACQQAGAVAPATPAAAQRHHHYYRKDGTCTCGKNRRK